MEMFCKRKSSMFGGKCCLMFSNVSFLPFNLIAFGPIRPPYTKTSKGTCRGRHLVAALNNTDNLVFGCLPWK